VKKDEKEKQGNVETIDLSDNDKKAGIAKDV